MELGAFWGAGIPIITYRADPALVQGDLPPIVQGDVWDRNLAHIAARAAELVKEKERSGTGDRALDAAGHVLRAADAASNIGREPGDVWRRRILWVDDRPDNNTYERQVFESLGLTFELALSTDEALERLKDSRYGAIISDMGRPEGPQEGYRLLEAVRASDRVTPFFIYAGSNDPGHKTEAAERGAQGSTNSATELVDLVTQVLSSNDTVVTIGLGPRFRGNATGPTS